MKLTNLTSKTLRWYEPFGGWGKLNINHDHFTVNLANSDTGLCNRLLHWEQAYLLNKNNDYKYKIFVQAKDWPELSLINLPHTYVDYGTQGIEDSIFTHDYENLKFKTVFDIEKDKTYQATKIDRKKINTMFKSGDLTLEDDHYYSDFGYSPIHKKMNLHKNLKSDWDKNKFFRPLTKIKLSYSYMEDLIKEGVKNTVGIHMRRFNGVSTDDRALNSLKSTDLKNIYKSISTSKTVNANYQFYGDDVYFYLIDNMLKHNSEQSFYISHDLPDVFLKPYIKRFGDRIVDRKFFTLPLASHLQAHGHNIEDLRRKGNVFNNIIDLFSLAYCPFLITHSDSTWSEFAEYYDNNNGMKPIMPINSEMSDIIEEYKNSTVAVPKLL